MYISKLSSGIDLLFVYVYESARILSLLLSGDVASGCRIHSERGFGREQTI